jgi:heptaprenyl diphosphate synthase
MTPTLPDADPALGALLRDRLDAVEQRLKVAVAHSDGLADAVSRHLVDAGGKRLRPLLTLLCGEFGDGGRPQVLDAAVVMELTHLATLYHDDVMDAAPVRRGLPSAHEVWGNQIAVIAGDLVFARASMIAAGLGPVAIRILAETFERLCLGQLHETVGPRLGVDPVDHYLRVLSDKTASLIATSARFGAMFAGCPASVDAALLAYGEAAGVAFQLADDVLDLTSDGATTGKTPGTDLREGVPTMPVLLLRRQVASGEGSAADAGLVALLDSDLSDDDVLAGAVAALRAHHVVDATRERAARWADRAVAALAPLPDGAVKDALVGFTESLVRREA